MNLQAGKFISAGEISDRKSIASPYQCFGGNGVRGYVSKYNNEGTHAIIGRQGALCGNVQLADGQFYATEHAVVVTLYSGLHVNWAYYFLKALNLNQYATATAQPGLAVSNLNNVLLPIPPEAEQRHIVEQITNCLHLANEFSALWEELSWCEQCFPDAMRKSVLQEAIQGRLVPQLPEEGTAQDLLDQICAEKERLVREGKLKPTTLAAPVIERRGNSYYENGRCIDDEIPFDIPDSWAWVRLGSIGEIIGGGTPKTGDVSLWDDGEAGIPWLTPADMKNVQGKYVSRGMRNISAKGLASSSARLMPAGSLIYSSRAPIGYIAIAQNELCTNQGFKSVVPFIPKTVNYLYYAMKALTPAIIAKASGTTFLEISGSEMGRTLLPLPPLREQGRIVESLDRAIFILKP